MSVDGKLVHSKKVCYLRFVYSVAVVNIDCDLIQNGDGYVDSDAKLQKIVSAIRELVK